MLDPDVVTLVKDAKDPIKTARQLAKAVLQTLSGSPDDVLYPTTPPGGDRPRDPASEQSETWESRLILLRASTGSSSSLGHLCLSNGSREDRTWTRETLYTRAIVLTLKANRPNENGELETPFVRLALSDLTTPGGSLDRLWHGSDFGLAPEFPVHPYVGSQQVYEGTELTFPLRCPGLPEGASLECSVVLTTNIPWTTEMSIGPQSRE